MPKSEHDVILKCLTKKELAHQYGVTERTILNWCQKLGIASVGGIMTPKQLVLLYLEKGIPGTIKNNLDFFKDQAVVWSKTCTGMSVATPSFLYIMPKPKTCWPLRNSPDIKM